MKKKLFILLFTLIFVNVYGQSLSFENFVVKENTSNWRKKTFYLGQIKSETDFKEMSSEYEYEEIGDYDGFKNAVKLYNEDIELFFTVSDFYKIIEIKIKTNKYYLYRTSIEVGNKLKEAIADYNEDFENYNNEGAYYFAELEDIFFDFEGVSFYNISLYTKQEIIESIILYYSFSL